MSNELKRQWSSDDTVYVRVRNDAGEVNVNGTNNFEVYGAGGHDADDYDVQLTNKAGHLHVGHFPATITSPGRYWNQYCIQAGASPADTDETIEPLEEIVWNGTAKETILDGNGRIDVGKWLGTAVTAAAVAGQPDVNVINIRGSEPDSLSAAIPGSPTENSVYELLEFLNNVTESDAEIDTAPTPWQIVYKKKGTDTELVRKDLKKVDGTNIADITTTIGQHKEPA